MPGLTPPRGRLPSQAGLRIVTALSIDCNDVFTYATSGGRVIPCTRVGGGLAELSFELDRSSPVPLYYQVSSQLEAAIERGDLASGTRLENEAVLARRWGLSRPTMRRAI